MKTQQETAWDRAAVGTKTLGGEIKLLARIGRLTEVLSGPLGGMVSQDLRVRPRQDRSVQSLERLLRATADMTMVRQLRTLSVEKIAHEAGVTPQAAYRYFKDVDDLIKTMHRCIVVREYLALVDGLSRSTFTDEGDLARAIIDAVLRTCDSIWEVPGPMREGVLWQYRQLGYDASMVISALICAGATPQDVRRSCEEASIAACLTATIAVATSVVSRKIFPLRSEKLEAMLTRLFVGMLRGREDGTGAFCDAGREIDGLYLLLSGPMAHD